VIFLHNKHSTSFVWILLYESFVDIALYPVFYDSSKQLKFYFDFFECSRKLKTLLLKDIGLDFITWNIVTLLFSDLILAFRTLPAYLKLFSQIKTGQYCYSQDYHLSLPQKRYEFCFSCCN
jgi:hypothetical protein